MFLIYNHIQLTLTHDRLKVHGGLSSELWFFLDLMYQRINCLVIREWLTALFLNPESWAMNPDLESIIKQTKHCIPFPFSKGNIFFTEFDYLKQRQVIRLRSVFKKQARSQVCSNPDCQLNPESWSQWSWLETNYPINQTLQTIFSLFSRKIFLQSLTI